MKVPYFAVKNFMLGGSIARKYVEICLQEQLANAESISDHFVTDVYLFDSTGYFEKNTTPSEYSNIKYVTRGAKFAIIDRVAQRAFSCANEYLYYTDSSITSTDSYGVYYCYNANSGRMRAVDCTPMQHHIYNNDALEKELRVKALSAQLGEYVKRSEDLKALLAEEGKATAPNPSSQSRESTTSSASMFF